MSQPKVSIIILNWNGLSDTLECLESLKKITYSNFKVLIVDNNSKGDDVQRLKQEFGDFIEILENDDNYGFAEGNNTGIKKVLPESDYVLMLNNDVTVKEDFLDELVKASEQNAIVGPKIIKYNTEEISSSGAEVKWFKKYIIDHIFEKTEEITEYPFLTGCCLLIKKEVFEKVGFLDKDFFLYYEDADFCLRVRQAGYKILLNPRSVIWHKISQSTGHESKTYHYYTNRNKLLFVKKHAPIIAKLYHYLRSFITLGYIKTRKKDDRLKMVEKAIKDFWKNKLYKQEL